MTTSPETLSPASPQDVAECLSFALRYSGRKRVHDSSQMMSDIVAKRLVEHLQRSGFVLLQRPPAGGAGPLGSAGAP